MAAWTTFICDSIRLLYWLYFKPFTLRRFVQSIDDNLDETLRLWQAGPGNRQKNTFRSLVRQTDFLTLTVPFIAVTIVGVIYHTFVQSFDWDEALFFAISFTLVVLVIRHILLWLPDASGNLIVGVIFGGQILILVTAFFVPVIGDIDSAHIFRLAIFGVAVGMAFGVVFGVAGGISSGVAFSIVSGVGDSVAFGVAGGIVAGLAVGTVFGMRLGVTGGIVLSIAFGVACGILFDLAGGVVASLAFLIGYFRLFLYGLMLPWSLLMGSVIRPNTPVRRWLARHPVFWDEFIWLPLFGLERALVAAAIVEEQETGEITETKTAIGKVAQSFDQEWAALTALSEIAAKAMLSYDQASDIRHASQDLDKLAESIDSNLPGIKQVRESILSIAQGVEDAKLAVHIQGQFMGWLRARNAVRKMRSDLISLEESYAQRFNLIPDHFESLIEREIQIVSQQRTITNPYVTGNPIHPDHAAVYIHRPGLQKEIEAALTALHDKPTLALYGPRRMGKTSLLLNLPRYLTSNVVPVFVDLQEATKVSGPGQLYFNWAEAAVKAAKVLPYRINNLPSPDLNMFREEPTIALRQWLDNVDGALEGYKIFFLFDEFEKLVNKAEEDPIFEDVFSILRHHIQFRPNIYFLFAGAYRLEELAPGGRWHDYFINVQGLEVSHLDLEAARQLITDPVAESIIYQKEQVSEIFDLTCGQPYLLQTLCFELVHWLNSAERQKMEAGFLVTPEDVTYAAERTLRVARSAYFEDLWNMTSDLGKTIIELISQSPEGLSYSALGATIQVPESSLQIALDELVHRKLIKHIDGAWCMYVELTRRYIVRRTGHINGLQ